MKIDLYECTGNMVTEISLLFGGLMSEETRERMLGLTMRGRHQAVRDKHIVPHRLRYGYRLDAGAVGHRLIHEARADVVRWIFSQFVSGTPVSRIARMLTDLRVQTPGDCNKEDKQRRNDGREPWIPKSWNWTPDMVTGILRSPLYKGILLDCTTKVLRNTDTRKIDGYVLRAPEEWIRVALPEALHIVDAETWDRACLLLDQSRHRKVRVFRTHEYMFNKRVVCGSCRRPMTSFTQNRHRRWRCGTGWDRPCNGIGRPRVADVEAWVLTAIKDLVLDDRFGSIHKDAFRNEYRAFSMRIGRAVQDELAALKLEERCKAEQLRVLEGLKDQTGFSDARRGRRKHELTDRLNKIGLILREAAALRRNVSPVTLQLPAELVDAIALMLKRLPFRASDVEDERLVASLRDLVTEITLTCAVDPEGPPDVEITLNLGTFVGQRSVLQGTGVRLATRNGKIDSEKPINVWTKFTSPKRV